MGVQELEKWPTFPNFAAEIEGGEERGGGGGGRLVQEAAEIRCTFSFWKIFDL